MRGRSTRKGKFRYADGRKRSTLTRQMGGKDGLDMRERCLIQGKNCCPNSSTIDLFLMNEPQSTSVKNMVHLAQMVRNGIVTKYNYGWTDYNLKQYGEASPPIFNLSNIPHDLPIFFSYGGQDALSDVQDVMLLLDNFKSHDVDKLSVQFIQDYAHIDFIMGVNAKDVVYNQVVAFFKRQH